MPSGQTSVSTALIAVASADSPVDSFDSDELITSIAEADVVPSGNTSVVKVDRAEDSADKPLDSSSSSDRIVSILEAVAEAAVTPSPQTSVSNKLTAEAVAS